MVSNAFWDRFVKLRERLAKKIKREIQAEQALQNNLIVPQSSPPVDEHVRVYIEANKDHDLYWESLGEQVVISWDQVVALERIEPKLHLRPTGLPMNALAQRPLLDGANGVILLWGRKTPDSLAAQISQVEPKLSGPQPAPGLVAYMMQDLTDMPGPTTINNWPVVRFVTRDNGCIVAADDAPKLTKFLKRVLVHKRGA